MKKLELESGLIGEGLRLFYNIDFQTKKLKHYYVVSNDEIKEGNWYYHIYDNGIYNQFHAVDDFCKKIILSNDKNLGVLDLGDLFYYSISTLINNGKTFERSLNDFSSALIELEKGNKISREGWNGKDMYLILKQGYPVNGHINQIGTDDEFKDRYLCVINNMFDVPEFNPYGSKNIVKNKPGQMMDQILLVNNSRIWGEGFSDYFAWVPSQSDILAKDWYVAK